MDVASSASASSLLGRAILCFPPHAAWFQGYFFPGASALSARGRHLALFGTELPVDACEMCPDGGFQRFRVEVADFDTQRDAQLQVIKRGGELCRLTSDDAEDEANANANIVHDHFHTAEESGGEGQRLAFETQMLLVRRNER